MLEGPPCGKCGTPILVGEFRTGSVPGVAETWWTAHCPADSCRPIPGDATLLEFLKTKSEAIEAHQAAATISA